MYRVLGMVYIQNIAQVYLNMQCCYQLLFEFLLGEGELLYLLDDAVKLKLLFSTLIIFDLF